MQKFLIRKSLALAVLVAVAGCQVTSTRHEPTTLAATSRPATLQSQLTEILNRHADTGAFVAARVIDPQTGEELFAQDSTRPVTPASNMKLTVISAALDFFGPDKVFETDLALVGNDLYLIGHGDPGTGDDEILAKYKQTPTSLLDTWADELLAKGITHINGDLFYYDGAFERTQTHPDWKGELGEWYAAPVSGLGFNDNCIDATATPATVEGEPPSIEVTPASTNSIVLVNHATTSLDKAKEDSIDWSREETQNVFTVAGVASKVTKLGSKPVTDPGAFFADALRTELAKRGITIAGQILRADVIPSGTMTKFTPIRTKFTDILARIGKNSQNTLAEQTAKKLGLEFELGRVKNPDGIVGSWKNAEAAIRDFFDREHIDATGYQFSDGSGLSGDNKVTTQLISDILVTMYHKPYFETFKNSLTIAGVDGTTSKRLTDVPGRVFCKTGYISGVRSLSGFVKTDHGKWRIFSIIYNKIPGHGGASTKAYEALQDEAVRLLMKD